MQTAANPLESAGTVLDPPRPLKDFTLTNQAGKPMKLSDLRGKLALVFFGYTNCPDVCPVAVANFSQVKAALGDKASKVTFVFMSVDGKRDTPEVLTRFLSNFDPTFIGLTGEQATVIDIGTDFLTTFLPNAETGLVEHGTRIYLVDSQGRLRIAYQLDVSTKTIAAELLKMVDSQ